VHDMSNLNSFWWGRLSDRFGRRPILLAGLLGNTVSIILFGYSTTLLSSIVFRSLNGLLNGNTGVAKTYIRGGVKQTVRNAYLN
jgi:MFS family permease